MRLPSLRSPKALGPTNLTLFSFALIVVLAAMGSSPSWQSFALLSIDTTALRGAFYAGTGSGLPIHDAYSLHLQTTCESYLIKTKEVRFARVVCQEPSTFVKFLPLTLIQNDLTTYRSRQTIESLRIPYKIQEIFVENHNSTLHVAFIFYIFAITSTGIGILLGGAACFDLFDKAEIAALGNAGLSALLLFVASVMTTAIQSNATSVINALGSPVGLFAFHGGGFMALTWCSCVTSFLAAGAWFYIKDR